MDGLHVASGFVLRILEDLGDVHDRATRHAVAVAKHHKLIKFQPADPIGDQRVDLVAPGQPGGGRAERVFTRQFRLAHRLHQADEHLLAGTGQCDPAAVLGAPMAVRHDLRHIGAHALAHVAAACVDRDNLVQQPED